MALCADGYDLRSRLRVAKIALLVIGPFLLPLSSGSPVGYVVGDVRGATCAMSSPSKIDSNLIYGGWRHVNFPFLF